MTTILKLIAAMDGMSPVMSLWPSTLSIERLGRGKLKPSSNAATKRKAAKRRNIKKRLPLHKR